jgi:hypothetical protein
MKMGLLPRLSFYSLEPDDFPIEALGRGTWKGWMITEVQDATPGGRLVAGDARSYLRSLEAAASELGSH